MTNLIQETPPGLDIQKISFIEHTLVPRLVTIGATLKTALSVSPYETQLHIVKNTLDTLDTLCDQLASASVPVPNVLQAIMARRRGVGSLLTVGREDPHLAIRIFEQYLSLEDIASQIIATIEQRRLDARLVPSRVGLLNNLIELVNAQSYLEIGCCGNECFDAIECAQKVGVDPQSGGTLRMTSDAFFAVNVQSFDIIFIDGLHESPQVDKDIENALQCSSPHAIIVLHDCYPLFEVRTIVPRVAEMWNGDVWRSLVRLRSRYDIDCATGVFDHGCAVVRKRPNTAPIAPVSDSELTWDNLNSHRERWLRPLSYDKLIDWVQRSPSS